jgi:uncharacterized protein
MNDLIALIPLAIVLCLGIFAQAASGFAAGLLIVSTLVWFGYPIPEAQASLIVATIPQNLWGVWKFRDAICADQIVWPAIGRLVSLPIGIATLYALETLPMETIKQVVAGIMLAITVSICALKPRPHERLHWGWSWLAFPVSGFLQGLVGMGGPMMVLWVQAHDWDTKRTRGFLFAMYLISVIPAWLMLYIAFGNRIIEPSVIAVGLTPLLLVATSLGLRAGTWLGRIRLKRVTLATLILIGVIGLASPWLSLARP